MPKKILVISALDIWSMGENRGAPSLWYTLKGYVDNGWKVYFITGNKEKSPIYNVHKKIEIIRFDAKWIKKLFSIKKIGFLAKIIWWLYFQITTFLIGQKISRQDKIDVFYGYEIEGVPVAKLLSKIFKKSVISRFQGTILAPCLNRKFWKIRFWQHILAFKIPVNLLIMTNDGTQGEMVLQKLGVDMDKVKFWMNGVDKNTYIENFNKERFKEKFKENFGVKKEDKILLTVSRLEKWKRLDRIIKAMPEIIKKYPDVKLLIIGDGAERKNLEKLAVEVRAENYIKFLGAIPRPKIKNYYNLTDIFISLYDLSNVGNPLFEAMRCGKCIVTLDVGDTNKFISDNHKGVLLKINELNKLPEIIVNLLNNNGEREGLGRNAREFADRCFWTWEERMKAEITVINNFLKND